MSFQLWFLVGLAASHSTAPILSRLHSGKQSNTSNRFVSADLLGSTDDPLNYRSIFARQQCHIGTTPCADGVHCADNGQSCCFYDNAYECPNSDFCCVNSAGRHCVKKGNTCCGAYQCKPDEKCCNNGDSCIPDTGTCCNKDKYCKEGAKCCEDQRGDKYCAEECVETFFLDFAQTPQMRDIYENMCQGIAQASHIGPGEMIVQYQGKGQSAANRKIACGSFKCSAENKGDDKYQCDEFPFASTFEGGSLAAAKCVLGKHNASVGGKWGAMVKGKKAKTKFRIKIVNFDCASVIKKRQSDEQANLVLRNDTDAIYLNGSWFGNYSQGPVAIIRPIDIPNDFVGKFTVDSTISDGTLISGMVTDHEGTEYGLITATTPITINVDQNSIAPLFIVGWAQDTQVTVSVATSIQSLSQTTTRSTATSSTSVTTSALASTVTSDTGRQSEGTWMWKPLLVLFSSLLIAVC